MVEKQDWSEYLFYWLVVSEWWSTINVRPNCIIHNLSSKITWQYPAKVWYKFVKIDSKIVLEKIDDEAEWEKYVSCRAVYVDASWELPWFFNTWYFYSQPDVHRMNMRWKLRSV